MWTITEPTVNPFFWWMTADKFEFQCVLSLWSISVILLIHVLQTLLEYLRLFGLL